MSAGGEVSRAGHRGNRNTIVGLAVVLAGLALIIWAVSSDKPVEEQEPHVKYTATERQLQNAVRSYRLAHNGSLPVLDVPGDEDIVIKKTAGGTVTVQIIDVCALLSGGYLAEMPEGVADITGEDNDNCDGGCDCQPGAHYVWLADAIGLVYSVCLGDGCWEEMRDGYDGIWP